MYNFDAPYKSQKVEINCIKSKLKEYKLSKIKYNTINLGEF